MNLFSVQILQNYCRTSYQTLYCFGHSVDFKRFCHYSVNSFNVGSFLVITSLYFFPKESYLPTMPGDKKGYIKPKASNLLLATCSIEQRYLTPLSCAVLSCIVHVCLYAGNLLTGQVCYVNHNTSWLSTLWTVLTLCVCS